MKTITTTVFSFDELTDEAKEKAREWYRRAQDGDNYFSESVIEDAETCAGFIGVTFAHNAGNRNGSKAPAVYWSGFSSQGDGACFTGSWRASNVKRGKLKEHAPVDKELHRIAAEFEGIAREHPDASFSVRHRGHYSHSLCTEFDFDFGDDSDDTSVMAAELPKAEEALKEAARDFMNWIYRQLEREWDYVNADAQVDETIRANEYTFTKDGKREG